MLQNSTPNRRFVRREPVGPICRHIDPNPRSRSVINGQLVKRVYRDRRDDRRVARFGYLHREVPHAIRSPVYEYGLALERHRWLEPWLGSGLINGRKARGKRSLGIAARSIRQDRARDHTARHRPQSWRRARHAVWPLPDARGVARSLAP